MVTRRAESYKWKNWMENSQVIYKRIISGKTPQKLSEVEKGLNMNSDIL